MQNRRRRQFFQPVSFPLPPFLDNRSRHRPTTLRSTRAPSTPISWSVPGCSCPRLFSSRIASSTSIVSLYTSTRFGFDALGGLLVGLLAAHLGAPWVMALAGGVLLVYCI